MPMAEKHAELGRAREQLVPILALFDDAQEHHLAALLSATIDVLERRIGEQR